MMDSVILVMKRILDGACVSSLLTGLPGIISPKVDMP